MKPLFRGTVRTVPDASSVDGVNCRDVPGPALVFHMVGGFQIVLDADAYSRPAADVIERPTADVVVCEAKFLPVQLMAEPVFLFGEPVLQKYYTSFDTAQKRVGFALAR